jgi:sugar lactone lactonase YvrE/uncharacterized protein (DUF2345 family)
MNRKFAGSASKVRFARLQRLLIVALCGVAFAILFPQHGSAQQITYYDFNTPQAASPSQASTSCGTIPGGPAASGVLFCFNSVGSGLSFIQDDSYTTSIDPNETNGSAYALELTQGISSQASSVWYTTPQNVAAGFTVWYAFRISNASSPTGDGLAFVIQNALGGGVINNSLVNCAETGSGLTALGGAGGCLGYGAIDNSIAFEADTFPDSYDPWDFGVYDYDDNHIALQGCGPGLANSPAHYTSNLVSPLVPTSCLVDLSGQYAIASNPSSSAGTGGVYIADTNPHQVVIVYNGPNDSPANYLYVYLDPAFNPGTHTPVAGSTPIFSGPYNIANSINLNNGNAYVGFTGATGGSYEQNELMGFTFTQHNYVNTNYTLAVSTAGSGSGTVSGSNCSTATYPSGTAVTCTATPAAGSQFTGWSGGTCSGTGSCSFSLGSNSTVVANFALSYTLTVTEVGTGTGAVTDNQSQISCGVADGAVSGTCSGTYAGGTSVTLTANATGTTTKFAGWGGACASSGASAFCTVTLNSALNVSASFVAPGPGPSPAGTLKPITAGIVYGQGGSLTTGIENNGGVSANSLDYLGGVAVDASGNLYVADAGNNRVLFYPAGSTIPTRVYGQNGSLTSNTPNNGGVSANSLWNPVGVAVDSGGNLYVADDYNSRVLFFAAGSTTATRVYGQGGSFTSNAANNGGVSANSLWEPFAVALDGSGNLYVADYVNNRVLYYPAGSTSATRVYGQGGSFTSGAANNGGISANSLDQPTGVALDSSGDLYVADLTNNRVLFYPFGSTTATQVYGQGGSFTSGAINYGGVSANSLSNPLALTVDPGGNLYVVDRSNNRVLFYPFGSTTPTRVYGQGGSFTSNLLGAAAINGGVGVSANSLADPYGIALDSSGNLYVSDWLNGRVLEYGSFGNVNVCPSGVSTPAPCNTTVTLSYYAGTATNLGATQVVTQGTSGLDFSLGSGSTCTGTVSAGSTCTVNVTFTPLAPGLRKGAVELFNSSANLLTTAPIYGIGQGPAIAFGPGTQTALVGINGVYAGREVALDGAGDLFIAENLNNQIVELPVGCSSTACETSVGTGLSSPYGVAADGGGDIFIADTGNNRVVEVPAGGGPQTTVASGLNFPLGVAVDGAGDIFIADTDNNRVLELPAGGGPQMTVASGLNNPNTVVVDSAGDVFIVDSNSRLVKIPAGCASSACQISVGTGFNNPRGAAVDAAGDVFIADTYNSRVVEVPAGCTSTACQTTVGSGFGYPWGVAVDAAGDVFVTDTNDGEISEINRSQLPSFSFALTNVGNTSADSPQLVSIQNVGNQPLTGSLTLSTLGTNFSQNSTPDCSSEFPLAPGASCSESFSFTPQSTGYLTGTATFSDNTLNLSPLVVSQTINLSGIGSTNGQTGATIPNVVGMTEAAAATSLTEAGLTVGAVDSEYSSSEPAGSVIGESPAAGTQANLGSAVALMISTGEAPPPVPNPLTFENNYFVTGDYATAGVTLVGTGVSGFATGTITIPDLTNCGCGQGVPDGADIVDGFLYWTTIENTPAPSANNGTFLGYAITGQQIGSDAPYTDPATGLQGTLRVYRADVNTYFQPAANGSGVRVGSGAFTVALPDSGRTGNLPLTAGASLVVIYRVLSPNFPLKSVVIYDGSAIPASSTTQNMQGFYDAVGGASGTGESTPIYYSSPGKWNGSAASVTLGASNQYSAPLNAGYAYAAEIISTPVNNSDNDGILNAWKAGPPAGDFFAGQPGYYDVKTQSWVPLPGAKSGEKDLFVQLDWMCGNVLASGACDPTQENLFPSPDPDGNDPLAMVQQAFAKTGVVLHLEIGNAVPENTCTDNTSTTPPQLCQFPSEPGVIGWKNSLEFSKVWPRNFNSCAAGGDCTARFPYGQKDSYHYVLFGHSLAIPAWNTRYGTLTAISTNSGTGQTTVSTTNRGAEGSINYCPSRFTISGVLSNPSLNGVYNTASCPDANTIILSTPGVSSWSYNYSTNTPPEPGIGLTSGTVTSISGYSDLGGADSAVTLALWETAPNQDMSKRAQVVAGTLFHEIGHTLSLPHGGLYYDALPSYVPTFEANCKPNYQSVMNYLFQLDGVGPNAAVAYSNQTLDGEPQTGTPAILSQASFGSAYQLTDPSGNPATFSTSTWYTPNAPSETTSPATLHCDGTPLNGDTGYRVEGPIAPITPAWTNGQNITFDGVPYGTLRGYKDVASIDLRQVGATGGEFASLASILSFGNSSAPLNVSAGGSVAVGAGGTVTLGAGGNMTLTSGGNITLGSGAVISNSGSITFGTGGNATLSNGGTVTPGSNGVITLPTGGNVTLNGSGTITLGAGGLVTLGAGGNVTLGAGGTITLGAGGTVTIPSTGGAYTIPAGGGTIALGAGGNVTLGAGGNVTLGAGGNITLGAGGNVTLGAGGNVTLGAGGLVALGAGGNVTLGAGGNVTLGAGGNVTLGAGGTVTLGAGGNVTLGAGGVVALGAGGNVTLGAGGNVTLGAGGTVTLGAGGNVTLGAGGVVTLGAGGLVTLGAGGTVTSSAGNVTLGAGGSTTLPAGGGTITLGAGGNVTLGAGGNVTLGAGGNVTLGAGGVVALGAGGNVTLGAGGTIALGAGGNVTLGGGGATTTELDYNTANSIVRPPPSATYAISGGVQVNWTAPAFGVVQTYTISRSVITPPSTTPGPAVVIGSVSGVNGFAPATTFTDTNPPTSGTLVYTIATTLVPDTTNPAPRQSAPSPPAVLTVGQTIVLGSLPSSVLISSSPLLVTATSESNVSPNPPNGLQVSFSASGPCSIMSGSQSIDTSGVSSATVALGSTGSCTITASQAGDSATAVAGATAYSAATSVSETFTILPKGSTTQSQTISFGALPSVQYGSGFSVSASSSASLPVSFTASGPCTVSAATGTASGATTGAGVCKITASAPTGPASNNSTYSAASATQSFTISTAPLTVTANPIAIPYGQSIPQLPYTFGPLVNGDSLTTAVNGTPALSTTATSSSNPGAYPITVLTGTLAAANYSFVFVPGTLTIQQATPTISIANIPATPVYGSSFTPGYTYSGNGSPIESTASSTPGVCTVTSGMVSFVGVGTCTLTPSATATTDYSAVTGGAQSFTVGQATPTISINNTPSTPSYGGSFTPTYSYSGNGNPTDSTSSSTPGVCAVSSGMVNFVGVGTCTLTASATATTDYAAVTGGAQSFTVSQATPTIRINNIPATPVYGSSFVPAYSYSGNGSPTDSTASSTSAVCAVTGGVVNFTGVGTCTLTASATATTDYAAVTGSAQSFTVGQATPAISINNIPATPVYGSSFTPAYGYSGNGSPTESTTSSTTGVCKVSSGMVSFTGVGTCTLTASATATTDYAAATGSAQSFTVGQATPAISINDIPATPIYGGKFTPTYTYSGNGSPTESTASSTTGVCTVSSGMVNFVGVGTCTLTANAPATTDYAAVTGSAQSFNVGQATPAISINNLPVTPVYGGSFTPAYTYTGNGSPIASTASSTPAVCAVASGVVSFVGAGTCTLTASATATTDYSVALGAPQSFTVGLATTTTAVTSSTPGNTSAFGQSVTFTATVTPQYSGTTPTGTVTFYNGGSQIGSGTLSQGQASFSISSLPASANSITAIYGGSSNFTGSTSAALTQTVRAAPIVSLSPLFVSFGNQNVNTTSPGMKITLTNTGDAALTPISFGISGDYPRDFTETNNCPSSLGYTSPNNSCTITVVFTPVDTGALDAVLTITSNDDGSSGSQQYVALAGGGLSTISGGSLFNNAIFATAFGCDSVAFNGGSSVDSFDSSLGFSSSHTLSGGNVGSNGTVVLNGQNTAIYGAVSVWNQNCSQAPSGFVSTGGGQASGGVTALNGPGNYPAPPMPNTPPVSTQNISGSCGSIPGCTNTGTKTVTLAPGSYGNLTLSGGTTAHLSAGTYNINSLTLSGYSVLYVTSGPVYVNIAGASLNGGNPAMDLSGGSIQNPTDIPTNLQFSYAGSQGVNLSGGSSSYATVYAPSAPVNLSGGSDFFGSIIGSIFTNSGGVALHYDRHLPFIQAGNYIWFNAVINNVKGLPSGMNPAQVKLYMTNSTINFTANGASYSLPVSNAVVTFNSASALGTTYSTTSSRWSTSIPASDLTGNTFVAGVAFQVPANFPGGIQNVSWSAAFTTDTPGITLQWQWGAAVYTSFSSTYATSTNSNALGVNPEDGAADPNGADPAGTPETYKAGLVFGATGCGSNDYSGHLTSPAGVVPSLAPVSASPSSLDFGTQTQGTTSTTPLTATLTNNDSVAYTISSITITGTDAGDFASTNNCPGPTSTLAAGNSCTISVTFKPSDVGTRTAKVVVNDGASNSPQTVYLSGTGH